jgi:hypothetical protein
MDDLAIPQESHQPPAERRERGPARLVKWEPWTLPNPSLLGHATVDFHGWQIAGIPIFRTTKLGGVSVGVPNAAVVKDGKQVEDERGKRRWNAVVTFANREARERWDRTVLQAIADAGLEP